MSRTIPFPAYPDTAPIDLRFVFADEAPAGRHGFLKAVGDHFEFEDGAEARFWGTNFNSGLCFPAHDYAEQVAERLAKYGCNIVRFHQMDSEWATPNIFQFTKGPRQADSSAPDPRSLDRLDYLISCLKKNGIYVYLDMLTYRKFKSGDGVENADLLGDCARPFNGTHPTLIALQKRFMEQMWSHVNPYTGLAYKDEPAIALSEIVNEDDPFSRKVARIEPYFSHYCEMYQAWAAKHGAAYDPETFDPDANDDDQVRFKIQVMENHYREMMTFQRDLGVKIPLTGTNWSINGAVTRAQNVTDYNDGHAYFSWGRFDATNRRCIDLGLSQQPGLLGRLAFNRLPDKPYFVSEWDMVWPCDYRAESPILMAAVGCLQNWAGFTIHTYAYSNRHTPYQPLGLEVSSRSIGNGYHRQGQFATWNDPAKFGVFYHAALILRRGDVRPSTGSIAVKVDDPRMRNPESMSLLPEHTRVGTEYDGVPAATAQTHLEYNDAPVLDVSKREVTSDTGELYRNWGREYGRIDSPRSQVLYGFLGRNSPLSTTALTVNARTDFAVIAVSSLTDESIMTTDNLLLSAIGRARNTGERREHDQLVDIGTCPILAEVIEAEVSIRTDRPGLKIWSINAEGFYVGQVPATYADGVLSFRIGADFPSIYYLIRTE
jgi:hypothetical protein